MLFAIEKFKILSYSVSKTNNVLKYSFQTSVYVIFYSRRYQNKTRNEQYNVVQDRTTLKIMEQLKFTTGREPESRKLRILNIYNASKRALTYV